MKVKYRPSYYGSSPFSISSNISLNTSVYSRNGEVGKKGKRTKGTAEKGKKLGKRERKRRKKRRRRMRKKC
jgi:hypothetical protein